MQTQNVVSRELVYNPGTSGEVMAENTFIPQFKFGHINCHGTTAKG